MLRFIVRRLLQLIPTLLGLSILLFLWLHRLPGGPETAILGERATPATRAQIRKAMGLDDPIVVQYGRFLKQLLRGDLGDSLNEKRPVLDLFLERFPGTIELAVAAMIIAIGLGIPLGYLAAKRRATWLDHLSVGASLAAVCTPIFFLGYLIKALFAVNLGWFPTFGRQDTTIDATRITGFYVLDGIMTQEW